MYRIHGESITRTQTAKNYIDKLKIAEMLFDFFRSRQIFDKFVDRNIYNLTLAGIHGLIFSPDWRKIMPRSRKISVRVAHSPKEKMIAAMICVDVRFYRIYFRMVK